MGSLVSVISFYVVYQPFRLFQWFGFGSFGNCLKERDSTIDPSLPFTDTTCTGVTFVILLYTNLHKWNCLH